MCHRGICWLYFQVLPELPVRWDRITRKAGMLGSLGISPLGLDAVQLNHNNRVPAQTAQKLRARRDTTDEPFRQRGGGKRRTGTGWMDLITKRTEVKRKRLVNHGNMEVSHTRGSYGRNSIIDIGKRDPEKHAWENQFNPIKTSTKTKTHICVEF